MLLQPGDTVLFQGDSITDAGRDRAAPDHLGGGYAMQAAAWFSAMHPDLPVAFLNRGVGGDRVRDLAARWTGDCVALAPTVVSILIGVNDIWRRSDGPTTTEAYAADYRAILGRCRDELRARVVVCEPFLVEVATIAGWREQLWPKIAVTRALARELKAVYVPFDGVFAQASTRRDPATWATDGVHPTPAGHALMARAWLQAVGAL